MPISGQELTRTLEKEGARHRGRAWKSSLTSNAPYKGGHRLHGRLLRSRRLRPGWGLGGRCSFRTWRRYPLGGSLPLDRLSHARSFRTWRRHPVGGRLLLHGNLPPHRLPRARSDGSPIPCEERGAIDQQHQCASLDGDGSGAWPRAHGFLSRSCLAQSPELLRRISGDQDWLTVLNEPFTAA